MKVSNYTIHQNTSFNSQNFCSTKGTASPAVDLGQEQIKSFDSLNCMASYNAVQINLSKPQLNVYGNDELINNFNFAQNLLNDFNAEFPNIKSSTLSDIKLEHLIINGAPEAEINAAKQEFYDTDKLYSIMHNEAKKIKGFDFRRSCIKKYNIANCGDRAQIIDEKLKSLNYINTKKMMVKGNNDFGNHVFNVIGFDKNADMTNPNTWGPNAVVVDAWANKVMTPAEAVDFYKEFLLYNAKNEPIYFNDEESFVNEYRKAHDKE